MSNFNQYSQYYDLLYKDKAYQTESDYVLASLKTINPTIKTIVELGCGSGNHARFLTQNNISITGIERSESMVQEALQKNIPNFTPIIGDICSFKLNQKFDAAISLFHVISYLTTNELLISCLKSVHQHLNPNGIFLFDIWYSPAVYSQKPETRIRRLENDSIKVTRIAESQSDCLTNVVTVDFEVLIQDKKTEKITVINEMHPMRHFSVPELSLLAALTGFELVKSEEFLTKNQPSENTWGVCVIFKKK